MDNIVCIKHPEYVGEQAPVLSCKVCCAKYISVIKKVQMAKRQETALDVNADAKSGLAKAGQSDFSV